MSEHAVLRVSRFMNSQVWAIRERTLDIMVELLRMRAAGISLSAEEVQARIGAAPPARLGQVGSVAILPLCGVICPKMNAMTMISGGMSLDMFMARFRAYRDDPNVTAIVIDADTPGGSTFGVMEAFDEIFASRGTKPIVGMINPSCGSAGLWITSACSEIVCTPSGEYGSLGVFCVHEDWSKANEMMGVKPTYISAGAFKVEGNPDQPLSDEAIAFTQGQVNEVYDDFVRACAKGRGISAGKVKSDFGQGRMLFAKAAKNAGMIDRIDTFDNLITKLTGNKRSGYARAAAHEPTQRAAAILGAARCEDGQFAPLPAEHVALAFEAVTESLARMEAIVDPHPEKKNETLSPNEDGSCPDGYEYDDADGMCRKIKAVAAIETKPCPTCNGSKLAPEAFMGDPAGQLPCPTCCPTDAAVTADADALALALALTS